MSDDELAVDDVHETTNRKVRYRVKPAFVVKLILSALLMSLVLSRANISAIVLSIKGANPVLLLVAWTLTFVGAVLTSSRWAILAREQGISVSVGHFVKCWMVACFFNQFLPSTVGGDGMRAYDTSKLGMGRTKAVAVVVVDRIIGLFVLLIIGIVALLVSSVSVEDVQGLQWALIGMAIFLAGGAGMLLGPTIGPINLCVNFVLNCIPERIAAKIRKFHEVLLLYRQKPLAIWKSIGISVGLQLNVILFYFLIGQALHLDVSVVKFMILIPVANLVLLLPVTINGIGLREGIFVLLLGIFGVSAADAVAFAWSSFLLFTMFGLLGGIVFAFRDEKFVATGQ